MSLLRLATFDPFHGLLSLQRELDRVFESPLGSEFGLAGRGAYPAVNAFRTQEGDVVLRIEVPGIAPDSLQIDAQGRTLRLAGRREPAVPEGATYHRRERGTSTFSRVVRLPEDVDAQRAEASYKHGVLTLRVPKNEKFRLRKISVQVH